MKKKRKSLLEPISKCCLKKYIDLDIIPKYGLIVIVSIFMAYQVFSIFINDKNLISYIVSLFINIVFLLAILRKFEYIQNFLFEKYINIIFKFLFLSFIITFLSCLASGSNFISYVYAPLSFLGAYFTFLILTRD